MKILKGALVLAAVVFSIGRAYAGTDSGFWAEVKKIVTYCEATKTFLSETTNDELFGSVFAATKDTCNAVSPGFTCDVIVANPETYTQAIGNGNSYAQMVLILQIQHCQSKKITEQLRKISASQADITRQP